MMAPPILLLSYEFSGVSGSVDDSAFSERILSRLAIHFLMKMAATMMAHRTGILAWYDCHISTGKVEGINNKIKVMKRTAYGFRDERYFELRLYALHDCRITRNVG